MQVSCSSNLHCFAGVGDTILSGVAVGQFATVNIEDNEGMKHCSWLLIIMGLDGVF